MTSESKAMSKEMFSAWEEWWNITGSQLMAEWGSGSGCELDAFAGGAEWMRGECVAIAQESFAFVKQGDNAVAIAADMIVASAAQEQAHDL